MRFIFVDILLILLIMKRFIFTFTFTLALVSGSVVPNKLTKVSRVESSTDFQGKNLFKNKFVE